MSKSYNLKEVNPQQLKSKMKLIPIQQEGQVHNVVGNVIEAYLPHGLLGSITQIDIDHQQNPVYAEVVGFKDNKCLLLPYSSLSGIKAGAYISGNSFLSKIGVGSSLIGKVIDPFLKPLQKQDPIKITDYVELEKKAPNPLARARVERPLPLGIKAIDGLLTFGEGQRTGIMAGSGVGKSVLMGMIARGSSSDINIIGLIGERGREVREFIEKDLGPEGLKKSVVVVVTSDQSPLMRIRAAKVVTAIAEYFSSLGNKVLLMMDSLTRVAQAQREIGLAVGEPPTSKGYPPSVFSILPKLLERCGPQPSGNGSISGLYTVLVDGDDFNDPIPDAVRSILDGHINLSRTLASQGHFPAIEVTTSASRVMHSILKPGEVKIAQKIKALLSVYEENYDFVQMGSYQPGSNPNLDLAIKAMPMIKAFLTQPMTQLTSYQDTIKQLVEIINSHNIAG